MPLLSAKLAIKNSQCWQKQLLATHTKVCGGLGQGFYRVTRDIIRSFERIYALLLIVHFEEFRLRK